MSTKKLASHVSTKVTPQQEPVPGKAQVPNHEGGYVFQLDPWKQLERFLILGSEGGTYYVKERELTVANAAVVRACADLDPARTVATVVAVSTAGRAPKNEPAILALALLLAHPQAREAAVRAVRDVCRTGTHLFHLAEYVKQVGGFTRPVRWALADWYLRKPLDKLALQLVKYQQRDGWSHRDVLCKAHPNPSKVARSEHGRPVEDAANRERRDALLGWAVDGKDAVVVHPLVAAFDEAKRLTKKEDLPRLIELIAQHGLPHECVPNEQKKHPALWAAMLPSMGLTALVRNLGKMTSVGLLAPLSKDVGSVVARLADVDAVKQQRVHPMQLLIALKTYARGRGHKGDLSWTPVPQVVDALDEAFYASFAGVVPSGKATLVGVDVSSSMGSTVSGSEVLTCCEAATAMGMLAVRTEPRSAAMAFADSFKPLPISAKTRLDDALLHTRNVNFGGTDCALPMVWAMQNKVPAEVFWVLTDNETHHGVIHPFQALKAYRQKTGIPAKLVVFGMSAAPFTIADPSDPGMMDVVGFDAGVPPVVADFARD